MKTRIQNDLKELENDPMMYPERVVREIVSVNLGADKVFIDFIETPKIGYYNGVPLLFTMVVDQDYPYTPPFIVSQSPSFYHPNLDCYSKRFNFSCLNLDNWRPTFSLNKIFFCLEMCIIQFDRFCASLGDFLPSPSPSALPNSWRFSLLRTPPSPSPSLQMASFPVPRPRKRPLQYF